MNNELLEALTLLEKEKNISKDTLLEAIEQSRSSIFRIQAPEKWMRQASWQLSERT